MNKYYTYELCSSENPYLPFYIGKGKEDRMYSHEKLALKGKCKNKYLYKKILKIKRNGYQVVYRKIGENLSEQDAFTIEKDMIAFNRSLGFKLCNHTNGGEGASGYINSEETKNKKRESAKNRPPVTKETRKRQSIFQTGKIPWNKGILTGPQSEETKKKISKGNKGVLKGPMSEDTKKKLSMKLKGEISWRKGKKFGPLDEKIKNKISKSLKLYYNKEKI
jgi:hypothetical protein